VDDPVAAVRSFNRFYTKVAGLLGEGLLDTNFSLTEARLLFEIAQQDAIETSELRQSLDLDPGYLSRILAGFEQDDLIRRERSKNDGRARVVRLTRKGRTVFRTLDRRSAADVTELLGRLDESEKRRVVAAMRTIQDVLERGPTGEALTLRPLRSGDYGWVVERHGVLYKREYDWDETFEALVARIVADYVERGDTERETAWIADVGEHPVGCVFVVRREEGIAQLRLLLVEPHAREMGIGGRLVGECIAFARTKGYKNLVLWTNDVLTDARRIYERAGFELIEEGSHHSFGKDLVEQTWSLTL
jgi:DNA-binding MarR family transcriptional regulator/N-acetylglutamate synthase-like GNAT family acetyltransferase